MLYLEVYRTEMQKDIERFYEKYLADLGWGYEPHGRHSDMVQIRESYLSDGCFWCLYNDGQLIGTVAVRTIDKANKVAELKRLFVLKDFQGKGYGSLLIETVLNYVKENEYIKICLDTRNDRNAAQHLFRKHGFVETNAYNDNKYAELYFELPLTSIHE